MDWQRLLLVAVVVPIFFGGGYLFDSAFRHSVRFSTNAALWRGVGGAYAMLASAMGAALILSA
jgi:hypothetical protein